MNYSQHYAFARNPIFAQALYASAHTPPEGYPLPEFEVVGYRTEIVTGTKKINWPIVVTGTATTLSGSLMVGGGIAATATGVGAPAGGAAITLGIPTIGFGVAQIIDGLNGGNRNVPSGPMEAIDVGFGGDGSVGEVLDIVSNGRPRNVPEGMLLGLSVQASQMFGAAFYPPTNINSQFNPTNSHIMTRDNTNVVLRPFIY